MLDTNNVWILVTILLSGLFLCMILGVLTPSQPTPLPVINGYNQPQQQQSQHYSFSFMFLLGVLIFLLGILAAYIYNRIRSTPSESTTTIDTGLMTNDIDNQKYSTPLWSSLNDKVFDKPDSHKFDKEEYAKHEAKFADYTLRYSE
jgi:formate hydrogenlyase subunit 3/multisubunit Na+/H+ antiporter MnhD subunit